DSTPRPAGAARVAAPPRARAPSPRAAAPALRPGRTAQRPPGSRARAANRSRPRVRRHPRIRRAKRARLRTLGTTDAAARAHPPPRVYYTYDEEAPDDRKSVVE